MNAFQTHCADPVIKCEDPWVWCCGVAGLLGSSMTSEAVGHFRTPQQPEADSPPSVGLIAIASLIGHLAAANDAVKHAFNLQDEVPSIHIAKQHLTC